MKNCLPFTKEGIFAFTTQSWPAIYCWSRYGNCSVLDQLYNRWRTGLMQGWLNTCMLKCNKSLTGLACQNIGVEGVNLF